MSVRAGTRNLPAGGDVGSTDPLLPIIGFGQETAYAPRGAHRWPAYLMIIGGRVLATRSPRGSPCP
ncbi:conserved hypothetical protein [Streptomyces pristinaespiralis ATCC 25486]|uniref:Uncharacterized protein n=1 Tax=Streptomyces pristinaespiralis (strain ATCC 25486 / DSM 40338 / CBS 914.69 / JCM 4507 / KCC S-0507 / NBRC 13074 / NRRL 2958 / 5647) TaxID=457429 RepID=B5HJ48_STRE2|nr:conserved hypothetical protein [Streptomyces pristinaespiralis ATCC 25486]